MKATVCELRNTPSDLEADWAALTDHARSENTDLVVLPEMPFSPWLARTRDVSPERWRESVADHDRWIARLSELGAAVVIASRPVVRDGRRFNEGFIWEAGNSHGDGCRSVHTKYYLPEDEGYWESSWYERGYAPGAPEFIAVDTSRGRVGMLICTEIWFFAHARQLGRQGAELLVCPRVTPLRSIDKWIAGGRAAAVVSGAYCLSSNLMGDGHPDDQGGAGWIIEPMEGDVLGVTTRKSPFLTCDIDLSVARAAKRTYPRYVPD